MSSLLTKYRGAPWLVWLGAVVLFFSWLSENYLRAERRGELDYLSQAQLLISVEEGHLTEWLALLLVEQAKDSPNQEVLRAAALKAAQHHLNILTWATARVTDPDTHGILLQDKGRLQEELRMAYEKGDTKKLLASVNAMSQAADSVGPALIVAFSNRFNEARNAEAFWRRVFLIAYGVGSVMVGVGVLRGWKQGRKDDEVATSPNQAMQRAAKGRR